MTKINQNQPTAQATKAVKGLDMKVQQATPVIGTGNAPYQVDITPVLLQNPYSPFAIALSVAIVIGALTGLIQTLKSR
ncbi:hypothetical protein IQ276_039285 [Desmonostoc muscorum LEGE 12446]|uniref:Uncharacterized protein n=1 Tax=Desmonostoc muscorum LEGE 12446 TaxID=1828758 RepID=A0A8J7A7T4_DESMC|nr:hypothetical protein [Desmonostoc muscorum]MCF2152330.1 hypothetical protein [Desmonostoc muscorum LEGE 12446]